MPLYDFKCENCGHTWEERTPVDAHAGECSKCGSNYTNRVWLKPPSVATNKQPYDLLDGPIPDPKKIKSFANDKRRGGRG